MTAIPPREPIFVEATDAERSYTPALRAAEESAAAALRLRTTRVEMRQAILRSRMTDDEIVAHNKAVAAGHPSAAQQRHLTVVEGGSALPGRVGSVSPQRGRSPDVRNSRPPSTPFDEPSTLPELETQVTGIGAAARRLAAQVARRDRGRT